jgi:DHA2 family multidrug resistance protein
MTSVAMVRTAATGPNRPMITLITMSAVSMQLLDTTIANVALPHMQGSLGATQDQISWVLTSYIIAAAISTPVTGWVASRIGRRRYYIWALGGFTLASALCGLATSLSQIVLFRILQGLFGAALVPLSQAILLDSFPRTETARAMGIFSMGVMVAPILGPIAGGFLTDAYSWRWCFYINVPLGILTILGALAFIQESTIIPGRKLDWFGFAFLSLAIAGLQLVLDRGEQKGWFQSGEILIEAALMIFGFYMFVVHSSTTQRPFFDARLFRDRTFVIATIIMVMIFVAFYGSMVLTPEMLQGELNYPVLTSGLIMAPRGLGSIVTIFMAGRFMKLAGPQVVIATGLAVMGFALYQASGWNGMVSANDIIVQGLIQGAGSGFINVPITTVAFTTLPTELRTEAAGLFNLARNIGSAIGVSIASSQLIELTQMNHSRLSEYMTPFRHMGNAGQPGGASGLALMNLTVTQQAAMVAYVNMFWVLGILCLVIIPLAFFLRTPKPGAAPDPAVAGE